MFYLLLAVISSASNGLILRCTQKYIKSKYSMLAGNYFVCLILSLIYLYPSAFFPQNDKMGITLFLSLINGLLLLSGFVIMQYCIYRHGVLLTSVYSRLGVLVPTLVSVVFFREKPSLLQIAGFSLSIMAVIIMNLQKGGKIGKLVPALFLMLILNGSGDAMSKIFEETGTSSLSENYLTFSFFVALVSNIILVLIKKERPGFLDLFFGGLLGIPNYFVARFLLKAVGVIPAFIVYPTFCVSTIILMTASGIIFFKEKINRRQAVGIGLIMISLILLNI